MGTRGPIPKRDDQRIRRNKQEVPTEKVPAIGMVSAPDLGFEDPHPLVVEIYESLLESAQRRYYEPSDWAYAKFALHFADGLLKAKRVNGQILTAVTSMFSDLLISEGDRRRVRLEVERTNNAADGAVLDVADLFRQRLGMG